MGTASIRAIDKTVKTTPAETCATVDLYSDHDCYRVLGLSNLYRNFLHTNGRTKASWYCLCSEELFYISTSRQADIGCITGRNIVYSVEVDLSITYNTIK